MHVIGTAGHVDHGKSSLVQTLTGIDPDRLIEEKRREMTIDLGFAWLTLDGQEVGIIDVPGHRDFIENMLAGVGSIDIALLVVAADEGVMPQTREHLAILDLLQVPAGIVALTKIDLVTDPDLLELAILETHDVLRGTILEGAPICPVSAHTGEGLEDLRQALARLIRNSRAPRDIAAPRLIIDRVFTLTGHGTIVTGTLLDGSLTVGQDVEILPGKLRARIRGLQTHKVKREAALPGTRVAANLTGIDRSELHRGMVLGRPGSLRHSVLLDCEYRHLPDNRFPLAHNAEVKFFVGAAESTARARIISSAQIAPGESGWVQFVMHSPVACCRGDRYVIRQPSPGATLGGGRILDPQSARRHRRLRVESRLHFLALSDEDPEQLVRRVVSQRGIVTESGLKSAIALPDAEVDATVARLAQLGEIVQAGKEIISADRWPALQQLVPARLAEYHEAHPLQAGLEREKLRHSLNLSASAFAALEATLLAQGRIAVSGALLRLPAHEVRFTAEQDAAARALLMLLAESGVNAPSARECETTVGQAVYRALVSGGEIVEVGRTVVYDRSTYMDLRNQLESYLQHHDFITAADARDLLGTSRKHAVALLEHLDTLHVTRRVGDRHERSHR